ncbi:MAG: NAD(P)/FAD-dependent oxidoreductase [Cyanobacteria bacterium P01_D01_bin.156]
MNSLNSPTIIIGAGFAGLFTALHLTNQRYPHPVTLIDCTDRFCFKPLLYDYMSGEMESYQIHPLYVELLHGRDISFVKDVVTQVDLVARRIHLSQGATLDYENLVLATGSVPAFFAEGAADHALTFQDKADADALKQHLMTRLEAAAQCPSERQSLLTVAIVGGGPVGVELALTLGDLVPQWYEAVDGSPADTRIVLLNRSDILQGDVNSRLRNTAMKAMENRKVQPELVLGASVTAVRPNAVEFTHNNKNECLAAGTIVWTAGTKVHPLIQSLPIPASQRAQRGQLLVRPTLQLLGHSDVFAAGDCAVIQSDAQPLPATAQVAYQQGGAIAAALMAKAKHRDSLPTCSVSFRGTMMKLGLGTSVANVFDRYEIVGPVGQTIRQVMYLGLTPTPSHNVRTTLDWIKDDVFRLYSSEYHAIDYTAGYEVEELLTLGAAVTLSAAAVSVAETGALSDFLETAALRQELAGATSKYPTNRLIHALFGHQTKRKMAMHQVNVVRNSPGELVEQATDYISQAIALATQKSTPEELYDYKELLYACCDRVARAAGNKLFDNQQVSPEEETVLHGIKIALNFDGSYSNLSNRVHRKTQ